MSSLPRRAIRSLVNRFRDTSVEHSVDATTTSEDKPLALHNPVEAFYRHRAHNNLKVLYRFAIQSRSLSIRDVLAKTTTDRNLDFDDLLIEIRDALSQNISSSYRRSLALEFNGSILLALADLLANTARTDLDTKSAVDIYEFVHLVYGDELFSEQQTLLYVEALNDAGLYEKANQLADQFALNECAPLQQDILKLQQVRYTQTSMNEWLRTLNAIYEGLGLTGVRLLSDDSLPYMDRLAAKDGQPTEGPKVSVIVPTYSPTEGIRTAIRGLLEQTWKNLEIIIVDDASPPEYKNILGELTRLDPRIRVVHLESNAGAYVARNAGLTIATGDFITTTDDDDWSHPDKITSQVSIMLADPTIVATTSAHIRTTEHLELRRVNSSARYLQMNYSSLMFRREVVDEIGQWDTVNRGADSEFFKRITSYYGKERVAHISDVPLSLSRVWDGSLTSGEMYRGFIGTPRVLYLWAIRQWHWDQGKIGEKPKRRLGKPRPYAVPTTFESGARTKNLGLFDVIYATDFFRQAKHVAYVLDEMTTLIESGLRVGYLHLDSPHTASPAGFPRELFELQLEDKLTQISLHDVAETKLLIVYDAAVGMFSDQNEARVVSHRSLIVDREVPGLAGTLERWATHLPTAVENLDRTFKSTFQAVGATERDQKRLSWQLPGSRVLPAELLWRSHVCGPKAQIEPPTSKPVVGFHSYGNKYRWPQNVSVFESVYLSDTFETYFYGQVEPAIASLGEEAFSSMNIVTPEVTALGDFLSEIDFWVYYPHPKLEDIVWEPALVALLAGKVVILPPRLSAIYGDAAVYAERDEVSSVVSSFTKDSENYIQQALRGQAFVESKFTKEHLMRRISSLMPSERSAS